MEQERSMRRVSVGFAESLFPTEPCTVEEETGLVDMVRVIASCPRPEVVAVVDGQGRLRGTVSRFGLAEGVLVRVMAEDFLTEAADAEKMAEFARWSRAHSAQDLMGPALAVHREDTLEEAFTKMHHHSLSGLPIVDQEGRVVGYLDISALLLAWLAVFTS